jgi:hypothetical protein
VHWDDALPIHGQVLSFLWHSSNNM